MRQKKIGTLGAILLLSISGCSGRNVRSVSIDGHVFRVPKKYLVQGTIPWLPSGQHDGLMFIINPEAQVPEQVSVLVQSTTVTCPPGEFLGSTARASACSLAVRRAITEGDSKLEKVAAKDDPTQWEYRVRDTNGALRTVANCYALNGGKGGLCTSLNNYKDLVFSVGLRDSEIRRLPEISAKVREMLTSWEVGPSH